MNYGICFLAYGKEHINEFNAAAEYLLSLNKNFKIFVATDNPNNIISGVYNVIKINEPFNYNLKRVVIESALKEVDTILFLDTDVYVNKDTDFSIIENIINNTNESTIFAAEVVDLYKLRDVYGSLDYMKEYLDILTPMIDTPLLLVHEGIFVLKITNQNQKNNFLTLWKEIDLQTRPYQKLAYDLLGAMEGIIMYISLIKSNIKIELPIDKNIKYLYSKIIHFGARGIKLNRTLI